MAARRGGHAGARPTPIAPAHDRARRRLVAACGNRAAAHVGQPGAGQSGPPHLSARVPLPADPRAVAAARSLVRDACALWGPADASADAELLISEVVTNAVLHAHSRAVLVVVRPGNGGLHVEVHDADPRAPRRRRGGVDSTHGRGLQLVASLARDWGVRRARDGKAVWFELSPAAG